MSGRRKIVVIGAGFSGLSAACFLARSGAEVTVVEKHSGPGGRARMLEKEGFRFDMGPSWYWMPNVFETFFASFGKQVSEYYRLVRLDPSYRINYIGESIDFPASYEALRQVFEQIEAGSAKQLDRYLEGARYKYEAGMNNLVYKPGRSLTEFADLSIIKGLLKLQVFSPAKRHIERYFKDERLRQMLSFPLLFLGALPENTPALYSLMNYADIRLGTWYPVGGMYKVVEAMHELAVSLGVQFAFGNEVERLVVNGNKLREVYTNQSVYETDAVVASADYRFVEQELLPVTHRNYSADYWESRTMAPSCLIYYLGVSKKIPGLQHHNLWFDTDFDEHARAIYTTKEWPANPMFYVCCPSRTDRTVAPEGCENLFVLIPVAAGLEDNSGLRERYLDIVINRMEQRLGTPIKQHIIVKESYACSDFITDYNAFKGNAYGLANTLRQTAILKPSMHNKKLPNLFYTGQLTVPGPGMPPSIISGQLAAAAAISYLQKEKSKAKSVYEY